MQVSRRCDPIYPPSSPATAADLELICNGLHAAYLVHMMPAYPQGSAIRLEETDVVKIFPIQADFAVPQSAV
jgi:hypothetical protein